MLSTQVDLEDYRTQLMNGLTEAWELAKHNIGKSQQKFDKKTQKMKYKFRDREMVYIPHEDSGKQRKLALLYYGPY